MDLVGEAVAGTEPQVEVEHVPVKPVKLDAPTPDLVIDGLEENVKVNGKVVDNDEAEERNTHAASELRAEVQADVSDAAAPVAKLTKSNLENGSPANGNSDLEADANGITVSGSEAVGEQPVNTVSKLDAPILDAAIADFASDQPKSESDLAEPDASDVVDSVSKPQPAEKPNVDIEHPVPSKDSLPGEAKASVVEAADPANVADEKPAVVEPALATVPAEEAGAVDVVPSSVDAVEEPFPASTKEEPAAVEQPTHVDAAKTPKGDIEEEPANVVAIGEPVELAALKEPASVDDILKSGKEDLPEESVGAVSKEDNVVAPEEPAKTVDVKETGKADQPEEVGSGLPNEDNAAASTGRPASAPVEEEELKANRGVQPIADNEEPAGEVDSIEQPELSSAEGSKRSSESGVSEEKGPAVADLIATTYSTIKTKPSDPLLRPSPVAMSPKAFSPHDTINTANVHEILRKASFAKEPLVDFLPYEDLKSMRLEDGIDVTRKEDYLDPEEFIKVFDMPREEFSTMPMWKRQQKKKDKLLF